MADKGDSFLRLQADQWALTVICGYVHILLGSLGAVLESTPFGDSAILLGKFTDPVGIYRETRIGAK